MSNLPRTLTFVFLLLLLTAPVSAQAPSLCADCHFSASAAPNRAHVDDWSLSPHGQTNVGCERCHGGNATTLERFAAHQGVLRSSNPASPAHRANLPRTCGTCHAGVYTAFQKSQHNSLLREGDERGPTCTTCHDSVSARLVSPRGLEQRCLQCHGPNAREPREGRAQEARAMLTGIVEVRESLRAADRLIGRVADPARKRALEAASAQARVPLEQARDAGHQFEFAELQARLTDARERAAALLQQVVNPKP